MRNCETFSGVIFTFSLHFINCIHKTSSVCFAVIVLYFEYKPGFYLFLYLYLYYDFIFNLLKYIIYEIYQKYRKINFSPILQIIRKTHCLYQLSHVKSFLNKRNWSSSNFHSFFYSIQVTFFYFVKFCETYF